LGSGIFVIPGLAARIAGPASIISWILLSLASYPFAYTFAKLSARNPESGGIYAFAREGLGDRKSTRLNSSHEWIWYAVFCLKKLSLAPTANMSPAPTFALPVSGAFRSPGARATSKAHHRET